MITWLSELIKVLGPVGGTVTALVILLALVGIAVLGKVTIRTGNGVRFISLGGARKRSCSDCVLLLLGKRERLEHRIELIESRVLKDQMNFAEQKLIEIQSIFLQMYRETLRTNSGDDPDLDVINVQYRMYQGILGNALMATKDEVRRSFKENGFENIGGAEFSTYVKDRVATLISIGRDYVLNLYPYQGTLVSSDEIDTFIDKVKPQLEDVCFEVYIKGKEIKLANRERIKELEKEFADEIEEFVGGT